jgi:hypothetical protein
MTDEPTGDDWLRNAAQPTFREMRDGVLFFGNDKPTVDAYMAEVERRRQAQQAEAAKTPATSSTIDQGEFGSDFVPTTADQWFRGLLERAFSSKYELRSAELSDD